MSKSEYESEIFFENCFFEMKSPFKLLPLEVLIYGLIFMNRNIRNRTVISIDVIRQQLYYFSSYKNEARTNLRILEILNSMHKKQVIQMFHEGSLDAYKALTIHLPFQRKKTKGFVPLNYDEYFRIYDPYELYAYCLVKKFQGAGYFYASFTEWGLYMDLKKSTAEGIVNKAVEKKLFFKDSGKRRPDDVKQFKNTYYLNDTIDSEKPKEPKVKPPEESKAMTSKEEIELAFGSRRPFKDINPF